MNAGVRVMLVPRDGFGWTVVTNKSTYLDTTNACSPSE
jgi:hypothetical protein